MMEIKQSAYFDALLRGAQHVNFAVLRAVRSIRTGKRRTRIMVEKLIKEVIPYQVRREIHFKSGRGNLKF